MEKNQSQNFFQRNPLRVLEFYSGIGGMHSAFLKVLQENLLKGEVIEAFDINSYANQVYELNFSKQVKTITLDNLNTKLTESYQSNMWLMSPPCQPYTRQGNQKGSKDSRTSSFLHLLNDILPNLNNPPSYILIENVKGFEKSDTRNILINQLKNLGFAIQEFLLSPNQFNIPNQRLRYFLLAKLYPYKFKYPEFNDTIQSSIPETQMIKIELEKVMDIKTIEYLSSNCENLENYLEKEEDNYFEKFKLPDEITMKFGKILDLVTYESRKTCCFTKAYGRKFEGTGSLIQMADKNVIANVDDPYSWLKLQIRYFTPKEIASLHGFDNNFIFPPNLTIRQCYTLLGNSLNVEIVKQLIKYLLKENL